MPISNQQAEKAYKKLQNLALTGANRFTFNEPFYAPLAIDPQQIWLDQNLIPNVAPSGTNGQITGVVQRFIDLTLTAVPGTTNSFYHDDLKDSIPHTYGDGLSYNISLKDSTNATISLGQNDWEVDREAGVLTFFGAIVGGAPSGNNVPPANMPPKISFYKYIGAKGNSVLYLDSTSGSINNYIYDDVTLTKYSSNIVYVVKPHITNTGSSTININGLGSKNITKNDGTDLVSLEADDFRVDVNYILIYDKSNDTFQIASGSGSGNGSLKILDVNPSDWSGTSGNYSYTISNYTVLGFKEIGSVQLYTQVSGNNYELVDVDVVCNRATKTLTINSFTNPTGQLRIVGGGTITDIGGTNGISPYLDDIADVTITSPQNDQTLIYSSGLWINGSVNTNFANVLFVDPNGSVSGVKGNILKPYTLSSAISAAVSGDLIIVFPGNYTTTTSIAKNGVTMYFHPNSKVTISNGGQLLTDSGVNTTFTIKGYGEFYNTAAGGKIGNISGASSVYDIECSRIVDQRNAGIGADRGSLRVTNGAKLTIRKGYHSTPTAMPLLVETGSVVEVYDMLIQSDYDRVIEIRGTATTKFIRCNLKMTDAVNGVPAIDLGNILAGTNEVVLQDCIVQNSGTGYVISSIGSQIIKMLGTNILTVNSATYTINTSGTQDIYVIGNLFRNKTHNGTVNLLIGSYVDDINIPNNLI